MRVNSRTVCTLLIVLVIALGLVSMRIPVGKTSPHDLDVPLPSGAHIYVDYDSGYSADERRVTSGNLTIYLPLMANGFWMIYHDAVVAMKRGTGNYGTGSINYDAGGNAVSYSGEVSIWIESPLLTRGYVTTLLHEWTHVFQFWIPHYVSFPRVIGTHLEAVADAYSGALVLGHEGWGSEEYTSMIQRVRGQLTSPLYGLAAYLQSSVSYGEGGGGYALQRGWEELWYHDPLAFKKFNTYVAALPSDSPVKLRDAVRASLFEGYSDYAFDGLAVDDWLNAFSFYNSPSDVPEDVPMMAWEGGNAWVHVTNGNDHIDVEFDGLVFVRQGTQVAKISVSTYDITIHDAQTGQLLDSETNEPVTSPLGDAFYSSSFPTHDLLRIDLLAHCQGGRNLPVTTYLAARYNDQGDRAIFFLNRDGYAQGSGSSNVGTVQNGLIRWTSGDNVEATVTWSGGTYTYTVENVMAHPAMRMHQIAVPLYKSRTRLSPLAQRAGSGTTTQFTVHLSPKMSTGTVTIYHSTDQVNWTPIASSAPADGLASFGLAFSEGGTHYLKAGWSGDGTIESSESSIVRLEIPTTTTTTVQTTLSSTSTTASSTVMTTSTATTTSATSATTFPGGNGRIVFASDRDSAGGTGWPNFEIYVMNADGSGATRLTFNSAWDDQPVWSPDGSKIAFSSRASGGGLEIYVMNADGSGQIALTSVSDNGCPAWSPDGSKIAFWSYRDGNIQIYVMNANGSGQTRLTHNTASDEYPTWSPDGSRIAFMSNRDGNYEIYAMNADGSGQTNLTNNPDADWAPNWSPDGSKIVFYSHRDGNFEVYVMSADGSGQTNLTNNPSDDWGPAWSPDGSKIVFSSWRSGGDEIYVMNADGSGQVQLTNTHGDNRSPNWQPAPASTTSTTSTTLTSRLFYGYVWNEAANQGLAGATVTASGSTASGSGFTQSVVTGSDGRWEIQLPWGSYTITFSAPGYRSQSWQNWNWSPDISYSGGVLTLQPLTTTSVTTLATSTVLITTAITVTTYVADTMLQVASNSSISNLLFDSSRGLLNFTVSGPAGTYGYFDATIAKSILTGQPVVLIDGVQRSAWFSEDANFWYIHATYPHSQHHVTIGGSGTVPIPEFPSAVLLLIAVALIMVTICRGRSRQHIQKPRLIV